MSNLTLAIGYVIVVLHEFWRAGVESPVAVGTVLEVTRAERNTLISAQVARDATAIEVATFRGEDPPEEVPPDASEATAALAVAQTQLATLATEKLELQTQVQSLAQERDGLSKEVAELGTELAQVKAENELLQKAADTAAKKAAKASA